MRLILTALQEICIRIRQTDNFPEQTKRVIYDDMDEFPERFVLRLHSFEYFRETPFYFPIFFCCKAGYGWFRIENVAATP